MLTRVLAVVALCVAAPSLAPTGVSSVLGSSAFAQRPASRPDLRVEDVVAGPTAVAGHNVRVRAQLRAAGDAGATFHWAAYLTIGGVLNGAPRLATFGPVSLAAGETTTVDETLALPIAISGRHRIALVVDPDGRVEELNEFDNVGLAGDFTVVRAPAPDLQVRHVSAASGVAGQALAIEYVVRNAGEVATDVVLAAHLTKNIAPSSSDPALGRATISVPAGATISGTLDGQVPADVIAGPYRVALIADPDQLVAEPVELDNLGVSSTAITISGTTLELRTPSLPNGTVFIRYDALLAARGGDGRHIFRVTDGRLPRGLNLDLDGRLFGIPIESGTFSVDVTAQSAGLTVTRTFDFDVRASGIDLTITTPSIGLGTLGLPFSAGLTAAGGEPPYVWTLVDGVLPPGLDMNTDGWVSGLPTQEGRFTLTVRVEDGLGNSDATELEVAIDAANVVVLTTVLTPLVLGERVEVPLAASGGKPPYVWRARSATPPGMSLTEDGHLVGTPSRVGRFAFRAQVVDNTRQGAEDTSLIHVEVRALDRFEISSGALPELVIREQLDFALTVSGGIAPFAWSIVPGESLPNGFELVIEAGTARLTGSSVRAIAHGVAIEVTDASGRRREQTLALRVLPPGTAVANSGCTCTTRPAPNAGLAGLALLAGLGVLTLRRRQRS